VNPLVAVYLCVAGSGAALSAIAILAPRRLLTRVAAITVTALLFGSGYLGLAELLSRPKPMQLAWAEQTADEVEVLASAYQEGKAIYLWLQIPGVDEPRAYQLPWSAAQAEALDQARQKAQKAGRGGSVRMRNPFAEPGEEDLQEQRFYAPAQAAPPPKDAEAIIDLPGG
jgi:hypothetical protein